MFRKDNIEGLILQLYSSAAGDTPWTPTLEYLTRTFQSQACVLNVADSSSRQVRSFMHHGFDAMAAESYYRSELWANDPRHPYLAKVPAGCVYYDAMMYDMDAMEKNPLYRENVEMQGVKYSLGTKLQVATSTTVFLGLLRTQQQGHALQTAIDGLQNLLPHLQQAFSIGYLFETEILTRQALLEALAKKADGIILLDSMGIPSFVNEAAGSVLRVRDGLFFARGEFGTSRLPETRRLRELVRRVRDSAPGQEDYPGGRMLVSRPSGKHPYVLRVASVPQTERFLTQQKICGVIYITDLAAPTAASKETFCSIFGLSSREGDLAVELVQGRDLQEAAGLAGMAVNTARNHLRSIFDKTGVRTQAELVRILSKIA